MQAMILAAGRGERLRPLTDTTPKPLIPVSGKPLIQYHIEKLAELAIDGLVINHAWLGEQFEQAFGAGDQFGLPIVYSAEPAGGLETAGGIIKALPLLGDDAFLVINGDVYTDMDFARLPKQLPAGRLAHLVLVPTPEFKPQGDFGLNPQGLVESKGEWTFAGISLIHPDLFKHCAVQRLALAPILREAMQAGLVSGEIYSGLWSDVGTIERLQQIETILAGHEVPV